MKALSLALLLLVSANAHASSCDLKGGFKKIVYSVLTQARADALTSFDLKIVDRASGEVLCEDSVQPDQNTYPASSIKTLIALAVLRKVDTGEVNLDEQVTITQSNADAECHSWGCEYYGAGRVVSVRQLLWDMITISNNIATNQLIDRVSREWINQVARTVGAPSLAVVRKVYDSVNPEPWIQERNRATSAGLGELYREIVSGRLGLLTSESREYLVNLLANQKINGSLNANFPSDVKFFHKTGNTSDSTSDGGFFYLDENRAAVLVGLQGFSRYKDCQDGCKVKTGFESLRTIGRRTLSLVSPTRSH